MPQPYAEFAGNKRLLWLAEEWQRYSPELAEWAMERLVNRRDVWSQYTVSQGRIRVVMLPVPERRKAGTDMVTLNKLQRHFAGRQPGHLIGLHSISDHQTCKWFAIDVDLHDENAINADEAAQANFNACLEWSMKLRRMGMDPLLMDSNGVGGYHVWVLLDGEHPLAAVYKFVSELRNDYQDHGLPRKPEVFPMKAAVGPDDLPYGLRLPGRHHTRLHYTRIWNFDSIGENDWLEGADAIELMLQTRPAKLPKVKITAATRLVQPKPKRDPKRKPRICVDLDGVLAQYDGWKGIDHFGDPVPGAVEFTIALAKIAEVVVFTSRCAVETTEAENPELSPSAMRVKVVEWLEKHKFIFDDVYVGQGKPRAAAFIDDRGVACRPQEDKKAFATALSQTKKLVAKPHG